MRFKEVNVIRPDARLLIDARGRLLSRRQPEWVLPVVHRHGVGDHRRADDAHGCRGLVGRDKQHGCRPVTDGRGVVKRYRVGDDAPALIGSRGKRLAEHGEGILGPVGVGVHREGGEIGLLVAVFVHVAAHDQRVETHKGDAVLGLILRVGRADQGGGGGAPAGLGHLLHADGQDAVHRSAGDSQDALPQCRAGGAAGSLHFDRLDPPLAHEIGHQRA